MKAAPFDYARPGDLGEAIDLLGSCDDPRVLAGGQSLVPLMAMRLSDPELVVDLNDLTELAGVSFGDGTLTIGAMTRQRDVELDPLVRDRCPVLPEVIGHIGHPTIRNRGTIGGSLAHADPAAELPALMVAVGAVLEIAGPSGERQVPAADFFQGYLLTALEPGEILVRVHIDLGSLPQAWAIREFARRAGDFAIAGVIAGVQLDLDGLVTDARLVSIGVEPMPRRMTDVERSLVGSELVAATMGRAATMLGEQVGPSTDLHGSTAYKQAMATEMTRRALHAAAQEVTG
ncbi:MAG: xanthine dehydrogenase family protein subunit M [Phycisphaeraceae bacterium]